MCPNLCNPMNRSTRTPCPSPTSGVHPNSCPLNWWCHPAISSSVVPFSTCPQSLPASEPLLLNILSRLVITLLSRSKHLLISWLQSSSEVILQPSKIKSVTVSIVSPTTCHKVMRPNDTILVFWMLSFKSDFLLSWPTTKSWKGLICSFKSLSFEGSFKIYLISSSKFGFSTRASTFYFMFMLPFYSPWSYRENFGHAVWIYWNFEV